MCAPERQSPMVGLGMKVTNMPCFLATSFSNTRRNTSRSAIRSTLVYPKSSSNCE